MNFVEKLKNGKISVYPVDNKYRIYGETFEIKCFPTFWIMRSGRRRQAAVTGLFGSGPGYGADI